MPLQCPYCAAGQQILIDAEDLSIFYCGMCTSRFNIDDVTLMLAGDENWNKMIKALTAADNVLKGKSNDGIIEEIKLDIPDVFKEELRQMIKDLFANQNEPYEVLEIDELLSLDDELGPLCQR